MTQNPKYTIIIPTKNASEYLKDCINSVISQDFTDYELIVSDNYSEDDTYKYVKTLDNPNIRLLKTPEPLGMDDHYEWVLALAKGEWIVILGSDDGVMPYFFTLLEYLTNIAKSKGVNVINSVRSYFFWNGCQDIYGDCAINYFARAAYRIRFAKWAILQATIGNKYYIDLPQLYTTSIVNKSVVEKVKSKNNGIFYTLNPPDANGAANICLTVDKYLETLIPISWVGSSPKSTPIEFARNKELYKNNTNNRKQELYRSFDKWPLLAGKLYDADWNLTIVYNFKLYLFAALLTTKHLQTGFQKMIYNSKAFKILLFANLYHDIKYKQRSKEIESEQMIYLEELVRINKIKFKTIITCHKTLSQFVCKFFSIVEKISWRLSGCRHKPVLNAFKSYPLEPIPRLMDAYNLIKELDKENNFIKNFISDAHEKLV
jgi:glycosyltransferase involved in cell wall biosynthesis